MEFDELYKLHFKDAGCQLKTFKKMVEFDELYKFNLKDAGCQLKTFKKLWNSMSYINFISKVQDVN